MRPVADLFIRRLDGMERSVQLMSDLRTLAAVPISATARRTRLGRAAAEAQDRMREGREWETIALDGSILFLSSQFELAVRDMADSFVTTVAARFRRYTDLPQRFREENLRLIGILLQGTTRAQVAHVNSAQIVQELAQCMSRGHPVKLFSVGFALHERNMTSEMLVEMFSRADVSDLWRGIATAAPVRAHFGNLNVDRTAEFAKAKLNGFMEQRNQIAHRGPNYQTVGDTVVLDYIAFFRCVVPAIADVLEAKLAAYP